MASGSSFSGFGKPGLSNLPTELLLEIFSNLDYKELISCSFLNKRFHDLANHGTHWKKMCKKYWLDTKCPSDRTWKEHFMYWYLDMGPYADCYAAIRTAWDQILNFVKVNCPVIYKTIKEGATEQQLQHIESIMGLQLPKDFRCSYRIHNGQRLTSPGLMGSMSIHSHYKSESLLDIETILAGFRAREGLLGCIPLTFCLHSGVTQYLTVSEIDGYEKDTVFYLAQSELADRHEPDAFITGESFSDWLCTYANHLANQDFVILHKQPFKFLQDSVCEETTGYITVSVATCFLPEMSKVYPPTFYHSYRITMSMSEDAPQSETCQLETRHWIVMDDNGLEEQVYGPGVVGEYPLMYPGASFSWVSCTTFNTSYGNMKGIFRMRNINTGERTEVKCPIFHMKCLQYITAEDRKANIDQRPRTQAVMAAGLEPAVLDSIPHKLSCVKKPC